MSLFDSVRDAAKNLVVGQVEVPDPASATKPVVYPNGVAGYTIPSTYSSVTQNLPVVDTSEIDKAIKGKFDAALASNTPALYTEFNDTVAMLAEDIPNAPSRYKAAIKLLTKRGATIANILAAFDTCIQIVEKNAQDFNSSAAKKIEEKIGGRKTAIEGFDRSIAETNNQIQTLTAQIQTLQAQVVTLTNSKTQVEGEIVKEDALIKLKQTRLEAIYNQIHSDLDKQKQALIDYSK